MAELISSQNQLSTVAAENVNPVERKGFLRRQMRRAVTFLPNLVKLAYRLLRDPRVAATDKVVLAASIVYVISPLDFLPDQFLTRDRRELLCATHGARFEIATGVCVAGPCKGRALAAIPVRVEHGDVVIELPAETR